MNEILYESIQSYNKYLEKLPNGCQEIANLLREDSINEALKIVLQFSEGVFWLVEINTLIEKNGIKQELEVEKIHEFLNEVNTGLEIQDYIVVADMFEYEIKPFFENCNYYSIKLK